MLEQSILRLNTAMAELKGRTEKLEAFYTHQQIEQPRIVLDVTHYVLHKGCRRLLGNEPEGSLPSPLLEPPAACLVRMKIAVSS
jgi:hypothetical protein